MPVILLATAPPPAVGLTRTTTADIVVYGGTPAGVLAAVTAKRAEPRLEVVLVEPGLNLGGMISNGLGWTDTGDPATTGGYARELLDRIAALEGLPSGQWHFEPHTAELAFEAMAREAGVVVRYGQRLDQAAGSVAMNGTQIVSLRMTDGSTYAARTFVDASYEGDLLAGAGVSYALGREPASKYGESMAGVRPAVPVVTLPAGVALPVDSGAPGPLGSGDTRTQDMTYRLCFSSDSANKVPFAMPPGYAASAYDSVLDYIVERVLLNGRLPRLDWVIFLAPLPNRKFDVNSWGLMSSSLTGAAYDYTELPYAQRAVVEARHRSWAEGLLYFLRYDPRVPASIRSELGRYGLCRDEFVNNGNWPRLLYVREGRRMIGQVVLRQADVTDTPAKPDIIGVGSYRIDAHQVSRWMDADRNVWAEGSLSARSQRYAIPYRIMVPSAAEATNLLVPVAVSVSHVAQASLRMEPEYMIMGEAAGEAAAMTIGISTQLVNGTAVEHRTVTNVGDVSVALLQARLRAHGAYLVEPQRTGRRHGAVG